MTDQTTDPHPLADADLLAWAVILEHRRQQQRAGITLMLLPFPPCPTCGQPVYEAATTEHFGQGRLSLKPCGHDHTFHVGDVYRLYDHIAAMLDTLEAAGQRPAGERGLTTADIVREARARTGAPAATEATEEGAATAVHSCGQTPHTMDCVTTLAAAESAPPATEATGRPDDLREQLAAALRTRLAKVHAPGGHLEPEDIVDYIGCTEYELADAALAIVAVELVQTRSDRDWWKNEANRPEETETRRQRDQIAATLREVLAYADRLDTLAQATISATDRELYAAIARDLRKRATIDQPQEQP